MIVSSVEPHIATWRRDASHIVRETNRERLAASPQINQQFLPRMLEKNEGHVVTIASMAGKLGSNLLTDYWCVQRVSRRPGSVAPPHGQRCRGELGTRGAPWSRALRLDPRGVRSQNKSTDEVNQAAGSG